MLIMKRISDYSNQSTDAIITAISSLIDRSSCKENKMYNKFISKKQHKATSKLAL